MSSNFVYYSIRLLSLLYIVAYVDIATASIAIVRTIENDENYLIKMIDMLNGKTVFTHESEYVTEVITSSVGDKVVIVSGTKDQMPPRVIKIVKLNDEMNEKVFSVNNTIAWIGPPPVKNISELNPDATRLALWAFWFEDREDSDPPFNLHLLDLESQDDITKIPFDEQMNSMPLTQWIGNDGPILILSSETGLMRFYDISGSKLLRPISLSKLFKVKNIFSYEPQFYNTTDGFIGILNNGDFFKINIDKQDLSINVQSFTKVWDSFKPWLEVTADKAGNYIAILVKVLGQKELESDKLIIVNANNPKQIRYLKVREYVRSISIDSEGKYIVALNKSNDLLVVNAKNGAIIKKIENLGEEASIVGLIETPSFFDSVNAAQTVSDKDTTKSDIKSEGDAGSGYSILEILSDYIVIIALALIFAGILVYYILRTRKR